MIIYNERLVLDFAEYGIDIPTLKSKKQKPFEVIKNHPKLSWSMDTWFIDSLEPALDKDDLMRVHSPEYVNRLFSDKLSNEVIKTYELIDKNGEYYRYNPGNARKPLEGLFQYALAVSSGTYKCVRTALEHGFCYLFGGGMHHAQYAYGNGFCLINDIVIAARKLLDAGVVSHVWVIDVDAHKGDGTAALTCNDDSITTLSIHMAKGWPLDGERYDEHGGLNPSFIDSSIDIPLTRGEEDRYNILLADGLERLTGFGKADIAIVVSGADPYEHDELPSTKHLQLSKEQLLERDMLLYRFFKDRGIPAAYLMAGGYGQKSWEIFAAFLIQALLDRY